MKLKTIWFSILIIFAFLCVVGWTGYGQKQNASKVTWEYKIVDTAYTTEAGVDFNGLVHKGGNS